MLVLLFVAALVAPALSSAATLADDADSSADTTTVATTVTLVGAGDIAVCTTSYDSATAELVQDVLDADSTAIAFTAGDNVYPNGSSALFASCYDPTWGAFKARTRPVPGNHEYYKNPGAAGYFGYFGAQAGPAGRGWYRYMAGTWRVYALTSECGPSSSCFKKQLKWLKADLNNNPTQCVLAIWHRPRWSSGVEHGSSARMAQVFQLLYNRGADVVINGHEHGYERFAPTDPTGAVNANGIREFVVGTGGAGLYPFGPTLAASEVHDSTSHGVLKLDLAPGSYSWEFMPVPGDTFTDSGSAACH